MQKEFTRKDVLQSKEIVEERMNFANKKNAIKFIEEFLANKAKTRSVSLEIPNGELRIFGYKDVTTIVPRPADFVVHVSGNKAEFNLYYKLGKDLCKAHGKIFSEENVSNLLSNLELEKLSDKKFDAFVIVFSALNKKNIELHPPKERVILDTDTLRMLPHGYEEQLTAVVLLERLIRDGKKQEEAVNKVLEGIRTDNFITACREYGLKDAGDIASILWNSEKGVKKNLSSFVDTWENMSVFQQTFDELRKEIKKIGLLVKFHEKLYELNEIEKWTSLSKKLEKLEEEAKAGLTDAVYGDWEELEKKAREMGLVFESSKKEELEKNAEQVGVAPCELYVRRRIFEYNKDKVDSEERIGSSERYTASLKESEKKEELQERLDRDKIDLEMTKKKLSNLENTLALITRIGASNEDTKPR